MSDSQTPRTDAEYARVCELDCLPGCNSYGHEEMCGYCNPERVMAEFARQLERELAERTAERGHWKAEARVNDAKFQGATGACAHFIQERDAMKARAEAAERELSALRERVAEGVIVPREPTPEMLAAGGLAVLPSGSVISATSASVRWGVFSSCYDSDWKHEPEAFERNKKQAVANWNTRAALTAHPTNAEVRERALEEAAKRADWQQVVQNGGPPCFHIESDGRFCFRAERWDGHGVMHKFVTLDAALAKPIEAKDE